MKSPSEVAQTFRDEGSGVTGTDVQILRGEREKGIAVFAAFFTSFVFSIHIFVRAGKFDVRDASLYLLSLGLGLLSLVARHRMRRATDALRRLENVCDEKA